VTSRGLPALPLTFFEEIQMKNLIKLALTSVVLAASFSAQAGFTVKNNFVGNATAAAADDVWQISCNNNAAIAVSYVRDNAPVLQSAVWVTGYSAYGNGISRTDSVDGDSNWSAVTITNMVNNVGYAIVHKQGGVSKGREAYTLQTTCVTTSGVDVGAQQVWLIQDQ
jgi:hypothetical protein